MDLLVKRSLAKQLLARIRENKVQLIFGTRRVGKTWLLNDLLNQVNISHLFFNGEDLDVQELLSNRSAANYARILGDATLLVIDEAQAIPDIGKVLKFFIDTFENLAIVATGSSAFDLSNQTGEPLTGRSYTYQLFPIAQQELNENALEIKQILEDRLIFGSYPEIINLKTAAEKTTYLIELSRSYLLKDILIYEQVKSSAKLYELLKLIAYQVGSEVSNDELSRSLGISKNTVERYLDLLSKVFIIYRVGGYSNNLRKEVTKLSKWYFIDNGIRNAVINDFRLMPLRKDQGLLWENYCFYERVKKTTLAQQNARYYFWRTYDQQELDMIENINGTIAARDFKWGSAAKKIPGFFAKNYPNASFATVNQTNYLDFIM